MIITLNYVDQGDLSQGAIVILLNDMESELVMFYRVLKYHLEEFYRQFKWALTSRQLFDWANEQNPEALTDIQRAARFYYLQKLAFGAKSTSRTYGTATTTRPRLNLLRMEEDLSKTHLRLAHVNIRATGLAQIHREIRPATHVIFH